MLTEPLGLVEAKQLAMAILRTGSYGFSRHAEGRLKERDLNQLDVINVIRGGRCVGVDFEDGSWRYRFETQRMAAVLAFRDAESLIIITAWRFS